MTTQEAAEEISNKIELIKTLMGEIKELSDSHGLSTEFYEIEDKIVELRDTSWSSSNCEWNDSGCSF